jgi:predicted NAD/FAD-binding protein
LTYPNLTALFECLRVPTEASNMSFSASLDGGRLEYCGTDLLGLFAQRRNLFRPRFLSMLGDIVRFYRNAKNDADGLDPRMSLGEYLRAGNYGKAFRDDHIVPMASAIWCSAPKDILGFPAATFIRFHDNHGLLQWRGRPVWRTVSGGSRNYVDRLIRPFAERIKRDAAIVAVRRTDEGVSVTEATGRKQHYDHVVLATHADQALAMLEDPTPMECELLGAFRYSRNLAVLHTDPSFMPKRRAVWSSWNYVSEADSRHEGICVTYWMNLLQNLVTDTPLFVTLNPPRAPAAGKLLHSESYDHPIFDDVAMAAQRRLWRLQGQRNTWFCGAYFGAGFHEDGLQSGLAVAEELGGVRRPWQVANESGRIFMAPARRNAELLP